MDGRDIVTPALEAHIEKVGLDALTAEQRSMAANVVAAQIQNLSGLANKAPTAGKAAIQEEMGRASRLMSRLTKGIDQAPV